MDNIKSTSEVKTPFQVLDIMFSTQEQFDKLTKKDKERNFFIINRRIAINFPLQAFKLALNGINQEYAVDCLYMITKRYNGCKPAWMYLKTAKEKEKVKLKFSDEAKNFYLKMNEIDEKVFQKAIEFEPKKMQEILTKIDKQIKILSGNKKTKS